MLRWAAVVLAAALVAMVVPSGAAAGGMSWFRFDRDYYVAGERAMGETVFWVSKKDRSLLDRAWYAYLIPGSEDGIDPPRIPEGALPIGRVTMNGLARVSFVVPDVEPGGYEVAICDRPCRHSYLGDLGGGWITVVESREEARLRRMIDGLERRVDVMKGRLGNQRHQAAQRADRLEEGIADLTTAMEDWERRQAWLETRLAQLESDPQETGIAFDRAGWAVAALALAALAGSFWRRRRRPAPTLLPHGPAARLPQDGPSWQLEAAVLEEEREPAGVG